MTGMAFGAAECHPDSALGRALQLSWWIWAVSGFTVRVDGQDRQIPANDVAAIDFTGRSVSSCRLGQAQRWGSAADA